MKTSGLQAAENSAALPSDSAGAPELSVVVPLQNEAENLRELWSRIRSTLEAERLTFELWFIDDGSTDGSSRLLTELAAADPRICVLELARNFGKESAMLAGLDHARGCAVVVIDADLQHPPEIVPKLVQEWRAGALVVDAVRMSTDGQGLIRRLGSRVFYWLLARASEVPIPANASDFRLLDREAVAVLRDCREAHRFTRGLVSWSGLRRARVEFAAPQRARGHSRWSSLRLLSYALDALFSFSSLPLRLAGLLGLAVSFASLSYMILLVVDRLLNDQQAPGYASLAGGLFFLGGIQLLTIWVLGEYVGRIFEEGKGRPPYVVRRILDRSDSPSRR